MKIFAYEVSQKGPRTFQDVIDRLHALPLNGRMVAGSDVRLEHREVRNGVLYADFTRERSGHGPGRMSRTTPLEAIRLAQGQVFGEDTALAFHIASGFAAVQYNHYGPRTGALEKYLFSYDLSLGGLRAARKGERDEERCGFRFGAVLRTDAIQKLRQFGIVREIEFAVSVPGARAADLQAGRSLSGVLDAPLPAGVETIGITLKAAAPRDSSLQRQGVMQIVNDIQRLGNDAFRAIVRGKPNAGDPTETIDLIEERLVVESRLRVAQGQRYSRADRWGALRAAVATWVESGDFAQARQ